LYTLLETSPAGNGSAAGALEESRRSRSYAEQ